MILDVHLIATLVAETPDVLVPQQPLLVQQREELKLPPNLFVDQALQIQGKLN